MSEELCFEQHADLWLCNEPSGHAGDHKAVNPTTGAVWASWGEPA